MNFFKNFLTALLVILLSSAIFMLLVKDKNVKDNILHKTLEIFGDDLLSMVPEGEQKDTLREKYRDFLNKAQKEELTPDEIEHVAANILNLTTADSIIEPKAAMEAFIIPPPPPASTEKLLPSTGVNDFNLNFSPKLQPWSQKQQLSEKEKNDLAARMQDMKQFHKEMQDAWQQDSTLKKLKKQVHFKADSGLKVTMNLDIMKLLEAENSGKLAEQLSKLQNENMVIWQNNAGYKELNESIKIIKSLSLIKNSDIMNSEFMKNLIDSSKIIINLDNLKYEPDSTDFDWK